MNRKIIIVEGYLAGGKSTFALMLSKALSIPYLIKDTFKSALCSSVPITDAALSSRFSAVTFDAMMYVTERLMETGLPMIIEGNFVPAGLKKTDEAGAIRAQIDKYAYQALTYKFMGDTGILYRRYIERNMLPERGDANRYFGETLYDVFVKYCHNLDPFSVGGEVLRLDTTDFSRVDFDFYIERARLFLNYS